MAEKTYLAIDLKSFYASVECMELGRDPLTTNLVVADLSRTEKTICLAVSPSLKEYGISGRARLFEVVQRVRDVNAQRLRAAPGHRFTGKSDDNIKVQADPSLELGYLVAKPQMRKYMEASSKIFSVYLKYVAPEDIHPYSIDEVFIDATPYLHHYKDAHDMARNLIRDVLQTTGITATAGSSPSRPRLKRRASERSSGIWRQRPNAGTTHGGCRHDPAATIMTKDAKTEKYTAGSPCGAYIETPCKFEACRPNLRFPYTPDYILSRIITGFPVISAIDVYNLVPR